MCMTPPFLYWQPNSKSQADRRTDRRQTTSRYINYTLLRSCAVKCRPYVKVQVTSNGQNKVGNEFLIQKNIISGIKPAYVDLKFQKLGFSSWPAAAILIWQIRHCWRLAGKHLGDFSCPGIQRQKCGENSPQHLFVNGSVIPAGIRLCPGLAVSQNGDTSPVAYWGQVPLVRIL